jgi:type I restriction enzyme M protein
MCCFLNVAPPKRQYKTGLVLTTCAPTCPAYGKRTPFTRDAFADFVNAYTGGISMDEVRDQFDGHIDHAKRATVADERWQCLTREQIAQKNDSLDLGLIADDSLTSGDSLGEPIDIAREALDELNAIVQELNAMIEELK